MPALTTLALAARSSFDDEVEKSQRDFNRTGAIVGAIFGVIALLMISFTVYFFCYARRLQLRRLQVAEDLRKRQFGAGHPVAGGGGGFGYTGGSNAVYGPPPVYTTSDPNAATPVFQTDTTNVTSMGLSSHGGTANTSST